MMQVKKKLLCKEGWEQAGEDCVQTERCKNFNLQNNLCSGWTSGDYKETKHTIKQDICQDNECNSKCNLFVCSSDTQGFKSESDRECIPCGETIKSGVIKTTKNNKALYDKTYGKCEICAKGQRFDKTTNKCVSATEISTLQMKNGKNYETEDRKCWKYNETFANCVTENAQDWQTTLNSLKSNQ